MKTGEINKGMDVSSPDAQMASLLEEHRRNNPQLKRQLITIFSLAVLGFVSIVWFSPSLSPDEKSRFYLLPNNGEKLLSTRGVAVRYSEQHPFSALLMFTYFFVFLQTFSVPGSAFLAVLGGSLWGWFALPIVVFCASVGASMCYCLSRAVVKGWVVSWWPGKVSQLKNLVDSHRDSLFTTMLFVRLTPILPNVFVNLASPIAGVPLPIFFCATAIGLIPISAIHVNTGMTLEDISEIGMKPKHLLVLLALSALTIAPRIVKKFREKGKKSE